MNKNRFIFYQIFSSRKREAFTWQSDIWGDGLVVQTLPNYWDDGANNAGDGWDLNCNIEPHWTCSSGNPTAASICTEIWGDGVVMIHASTNWDDGNLSSNDGWSSTWTVEPGWSWSGGTPTTSDTWIVILGDGITISPEEEWDDGNLINYDGWSSSSKIESGFQWVIDLSQNIPSVWSEIWGDGRKIYSNQWDDGNLNDGDGCSSSWQIEIGYSCLGVSFNSPDICSIIWGDGVSTGLNPLEWDDGNTRSDDGWSSKCLIENGFLWTKATPLSPHIWDEKWGDGLRFYLQWDDGNQINGDGCSSLCTPESGFIWSGGSSSKKDIWLEIWGDNKDYGLRDWEDGNNIDGDGWSKDWEIEKCYEWVGGTINSKDIWTPLHTSASISKSSGMTKY